MATWQETLLNVPQELDNFPQLHFTREISSKTINSLDAAESLLEDLVCRAFMKPLQLSSVPTQDLCFIQKTKFLYLKIV